MFTFFLFYVGVCLKLLCCGLCLGHDSWLNIRSWAQWFQVIYCSSSNCPEAHINHCIIPIFFCPVCTLMLFLLYFFFFYQSCTFTEFSVFLLQIMWILFVLKFTIPFSCASVFFSPIFINGVDSNLCFLNSDGRYGHLMTRDINFFKWPTLICYLNIHYFIL